MAGGRRDHQMEFTGCLRFNNVKIFGKSPVRFANDSGTESVDCTSSGAKTANATVFADDLDANGDVVSTVKATIVVNFTEHNGDNPPTLMSATLTVTNKAGDVTIKEVTIPRPDKKKLQKV